MAVVCSSLATNWATKTMRCTAIHHHDAFFSRFVSNASAASLYLSAASFTLAAPIQMRRSLHAPLATSSTSLWFFVKTAATRVAACARSLSHVLCTEVAGPSLPMPLTLSWLSPSSFSAAGCVSTAASAAHGFPAKSTRTPPASFAAARRNLDASEVMTFSSSPRIPSTMGVVVGSVQSPPLSRLFIVHVFSSLPLALPTVPLLPSSPFPWELSSTPPSSSS
mmetsp:Transcript_59290/g.116335  ORF Transcript_59290/g.116335 Transcript_59290/m.116335 type:complete len:222 (-) Transcript_59290:35-700(-)